MNRLYNGSVLVGFSMLVVGSAQPATAAGAEPEKVIHQLLDLSGTSEMIESFPALVDQQIANQVGKLEGEDGVFLRQALMAAFDPARIRTSIVAALRESYDDAKARSALEWEQSDLASRVRAEELRSLRPEAQQELALFAQSFQTTPPDPKRLELARRLDAASQSSALAVEIAMEFLRGLLGGIAAITPAENQPASPEDIDQLISQQMTQLGPIVQAQTLASLLFTSRHLSIDEFRSYIAYVESEPGQWFHLHLGAGLVRSIARGGGAVADHLAAWSQRRQFSDKQEAEQLCEIATAEGHAFGKKTTQTACTDSAFERQNACHDFACFAKVRTFLESCLSTSRQDAGLCAGTPEPDDLASSIYWRLERCEQRGTTTSACNDLMGVIQDHCSSPPTHM